MNRLAEAIQKLLGHAIVMTKDLVVARELLQDLAVKVFSKPEYYIDKSDEDLGRILYYNMRNIYVDRIRWERRNLICEIPINYDTEVENDIWNNIRKKEVLKALQSLKNEKHKLCFRLRLQEGNIRDFMDLLPYNKNEIAQSIEYAKTHIKKQLKV